MLRSMAREYCTTIVGLPKPRRQTKHKTDGPTRRCLNEIKILIIWLQLQGIHLKAVLRHNQDNARLYSHKLKVSLLLDDNAKGRPLESLLEATHVEQILPWFLICSVKGKYLASRDFVPMTRIISRIMFNAGDPPPSSRRRSPSVPNLTTRVRQQSVAWHIPQCQS